MELRAEVEFRMLGALELVSGGRPVPLGPAKQQVLLAAVAVDAGHPVPVATLIDRIWDDAPPADARRVLHTYVARVRAVLASAVGSNGGALQLDRRSGGYQLVADPLAVDLHRFRQLVGQARGLEVRDQYRAALLGQALALWRGEPLSGLTGAWAERIRQRFGQQRLDAAADWAQAELANGRHDVVIEQLPDLVLENPLAEALIVRLLQALELTGRHTEALDVYAKARRRITEEIGAEPGQALQALHQRLLRGRSSADPTAPPGAGPAPPAPATDPVPAGAAQLPLDILGFVGRRADLACLDAIAVRAAAASTGVAVCGIWGTAGVGKTTLAVHWAQRARDRFPDGQLYVNLRGFDPSGSPMTAGEAVRGFLDALGVPPQRVPATADAQAGLYRSLLAGRRMLILLDNAHDADQVRPLLPGAPGCLVLVTSRNQLASLVATEGAQPLTLDLLTAGEARQLLTLRVGAERVAVEPDAVAEIIDRCARLPLALAIVAARAVSAPAEPLASLAAELRDAGSGLDALEPDDAASDLRRVFSWSYQALTRPTARLFRLLGGIPGPDIAEPALASLAGLPVARVRPLLRELARAHLVRQHAQHRYSCHDLLRAFAAELARAEDSDDERRAALCRLLDHYLTTAFAAAHLILPSRQPVAIGPSCDGVTAAAVTDLAEAMAWFTAEHAALLALVRRAAAEGFDVHVWQLAWSMRDFLDRKRLLHDHATVQYAGLEAARRLGDWSAQAEAHRSLGRVNTVQGRDDEAAVHYRHAFTLRHALGDHIGEAGIHLSIGMLTQRQGDMRESLRHHRKALALFELADHTPGRANALNNIALNLLELGDTERALSHCEEAITLVRKADEPWSEAAIWDSLGSIHLRLGQPERSVECCLRCLHLIKLVGDRYHESLVLVHLADAHEAAGDGRAATDALRGAVAILAEIGHADADTVRARLAASPGAGGH